ncbi:MAG: glycosyltransferase family 2 protein [Bradymonadales bacterium]|nr:glycosyltransferase family 2 protein [Bradymonadales bacterium]
MPIDLSVVMFAYNEGRHLRQVVTETIHELDRHAGDYEIILVDDGSTDDTPAIVQELAACCPRLVGIRHPVNRGIGEAVHTGYRAATHEFLCILPADGQIRMSEMVKLFDAARRGADLVLGRYRQRGEVDSVFRMVLSKGLRMLMRVLLGVDRQIDSAFLFRRSILSEIPLKSRSFFVNLELPIRVLRGRYRVAEEEITVFPRISGSSKVVKGRQVVSVARDLLKLRLQIWGENRGGDSPIAKAIH